MLWRRVILLLLGAARRVLALRIEHCQDLRWQRRSRAGAGWRRGQWCWRRGVGAGTVVRDVTRSVRRWGVGGGLGGRIRRIALGRWWIGCGRLALGCRLRGKGWGREGGCLGGRREGG